MFFWVDQYFNFVMSMLRMLLCINIQYHQLWWHMPVGGMCWKGRSKMFMSSSPAWANPWGEEDGSVGVEALASKPDSIPWSHMMEEEGRFLWIVLWPLCVQPKHAPTCKWTNVIFKLFFKWANKFMCDIKWQNNLMFGAISAIVRNSILIPGQNSLDYLLL